VSFFGKYKGPTPPTPPAADPGIVLITFDRNVPEAPAYWLVGRDEVRGPYGFATGRYTEDAGEAFKWVQGGGIARLMRLWRLPDGRLVLKDPRTGGIPLAKMLTAEDKP